MRIPVISAYIGLILILLSPARDLYADFSIIGSLLTILLVSLRDRQLQETKGIVTVLYLLGISGFVFGQIQPVDWLMIFPFSYYYLVSTALMIGLVATIRIEVRDNASD